ncbi:MAG: hypothetical protein COT73_09830 [Bdellovibrio sp. CG10_big_fil_rev_8_21_14_0_10_47_8]|nr:MAG: hypothetical protein COT73_09830 [Bdellovibrio sp. CG10_big_fil_rev_8_21_14_0_10_47_8]
MSKAKIIVFVSVFILSAVAGVVLYQNRVSINRSDSVEVDWRLLGELDYISGKASSELQALDGKMVRIPGFMVPLEDNSRAVSEFLLVPSPQACIHVPPPPPNQMVLIDMDKNSDAKVEYGPIWVYGRLSLTPKKHQYGESSFSMQGQYIEPYR